MRRIKGTHELPCDASRRGQRNEVQEAIQSENKKDYARQISGNCGNGSHNRVLLLDWQPFHGVNHIDVDIIDGVYLEEIQEFYEPGQAGTGARLAGNDEGD